MVGGPAPSFNGHRPGRQAASETASQGEPMSRGVLTLLDPKGNAFLVAREGLELGYDLALVTAAPETLKGVPEQFQDVIDRLKMVVRIHSWQDLKSVFRATRRIESELGPIRGT